MPQINLTWSDALEGYAHDDEPFCGSCSPLPAKVGEIAEPANGQQIGVPGNLFVKRGRWEAQPRFFTEATAEGETRCCGWCGLESFKPNPPA